MLKSLSIKNFIIIDSIEIHFVDGLNIITGETGSGKSIIIDAMNVLLGDRASTDLIRQNETKAIVEAFIDIAHQDYIKIVLQKNDIETDTNELIIRREISAKGANRNFINDSPVTLNLLKEIGLSIVDFHGQHDNQLLLNSDRHIEILDSYSQNKNLLGNYQIKYSCLKQKIDEYKNLILQEKNLLRKVEFMKFQLEEIDKINPKLNEDEILENELKLIENAEILHLKSNELYSNLYDDENSAINLLSKSEKIIRDLSSIDSRFEDYKNEVSSALISVKEVSSFVNDYISNIEFSPEKTEEIRQRIFQLKSLQKKYGAISDILKLKEDNLKELSLAENFDLAKTTLINEIESFRKETTIIASELSINRKKSALKFSQSIEHFLMEVGIQHPKFEIIFENKLSQHEFLYFHENHNRFEFNNLGIDLLEFYISTNKGEIERPLSQIASGGEVSRVMLAIKSQMAEKENLPTLVFDEIDTGISGRIAQKVGISLKNLSKKHQIISITHLPQIAALGDRNIIIEKVEINNRTNATAKIVEGKDRLIEIAKMLSGEEITESTIQSAKELTEVPF